jgi:hypothetical protein
MTRARLARKSARGELLHMLELRPHRMRAVARRFEESAVEVLHLSLVAYRFRGHAGVIKSVEAARTQ